DLFFASKIRGTGEQVGARIVFVKSISDAMQKTRDESPVLVIADLNARCCNVIELAGALKSDDALSGIPLLGFFSHVQTDLERTATDAGFDRVIPRSVFARDLVKILSESD